jgi:DNA-directed RNA polymerase specialized sigma24 family protein
VDHPPERFARLYDQYYRNILRYALQHAEPGTGEDVASEVFLIAWRKLPDVPEPALPWLLGVARNLLRQQAGAGHRRRLLADRIAALTSAADMTAWDAGEHIVERESALEVLTSLPERDVEALTLVTWHGLDVREAAAAAGCSPRAFTVRLLAPGLYRPAAPGPAPPGQRRCARRTRPKSGRRTALGRATRNGRPPFPLRLIPIKWSRHEQD